MRTLYQAPPSYPVSMRDVLTGAVVKLIRRPTSNNAPQNVIVVVDGREVATVNVNELTAAIREATS